MIYAGGIGILKLYKTLNSKSVRLNFDFYYFEKHNFVSKKQVEPKTVCLFNCSLQMDDRVRVVTAGRLQVTCQRAVIAIPPHHAGLFSFEVQPKFLD